MTTSVAQIKALLKNLSSSQRARLEARFDFNSINLMTMSESEAKELLDRLTAIVGTEAMTNPIADGLRDSAVADREKAKQALKDEETCRQNYLALCASRNDLRNSSSDYDVAKLQQLEHDINMAWIEYDCASMNREYRVRRANHTEMCADIAEQRSGGLDFRC